MQEAKTVSEWGVIKGVSGVSEATGVSERRGTQGLRGGDRFSGKTLRQSAGAMIQAIARLDTSSRD
jgi:hypothetical protein